LLIPLTVLLFISWIYEEVKNRRAKREAELLDDEIEEFDAFAGGHPVPPLPGQVLKSEKPALQVEES
jgi:NADH-quinone oxidoreductase subunit H